MSTISTIVDVVAGLATALGGITLMQELYRTMAFRTVEARVAGWTPIFDSEGKITGRCNARYAFVVDGQEVEHEARETSFKDDIAATPLGSMVRIRYLPSNPDVPELAPKPKGAYVFPLSSLAIGIGLFVVGGLLR